MTDTLRRALTDQTPLRAARIPLDKIRVHPRNLRLDLGDLTELAASLAADGQHQPALVHRKGEFFELLDGHRRYGASVIARRRTLDCVVVPTRSDADAIRTMLATGLHTRQLTAEERAKGVETLVAEFGWSVQRAATELGVSTTTVRRWRTADDPAPADGADPSARVCRPTRPSAVVSRRRVTELADRWQSRCADGLDRDDALALLAELRALAGPR